MQQYDIPSEFYKTLENHMAFKKILAQIYAETPLIITLEKKCKIVTNPGIFILEENKGKIEIGFEIKPL